MQRALDQSDQKMELQEICRQLGFVPTSIDYSSGHGYNQCYYVYFDYELE